MSNNSSGRKVRPCTFHDGHYVSTNWMRRFVYAGDVVVARRNDVPPGSRETDTHLLACAHKHGQLVFPKGA